MTTASHPQLVPTPRGPLVLRPAETTESAIRLSLVIPTFNEAKNVATLVEQLEQLLTPLLGDAYELIIVDDDSPDQTWSLALALIPQHPHVRVVRRVGERGLSTAVIRGWQVARGDVLGVMDADLQHPVEVNSALFREIENGAELAAASRHVVGGGVSEWSLLRRMLSRGAQLLGLVILPAVLGRLSDPMSGYFMLKRRVLEGVELDPLGYKILIEVVARARPRWIAECGYVFRERVEGESKVTWRLYLDYVKHLLKLRWVTLPHSRLFRFLVVGTSGVAVDMAVLYLLSDPSTLGLGLTRSKIVAAEIAIVTNFMFNEVWTFSDISRAVPALASRWRRFLTFNAVCSAGLVLSVIILNVLVSFFHVNRYLANAIAIACVSIWNYWLNKNLIGARGDRA